MNDLTFAKLEERVDALGPDQQNVFIVTAQQFFNSGGTGIQNALIIFTS
jgi:hypothetical protein